MRVIVPSCPGYSDTWLPFGALWEHYWPGERPLLVTARAPAAYPRQCDVLELDADRGWCATLMAGLDAVSDERVLVMQDDFFLNAPVDQAFVEHCDALLQEQPGVVFVRLFPCPGPEGGGVTSEPRLAEFLRRQPFLVSCQATLWRSSVLRAVLARSRGTAAMFEYRGTRFARWRLPASCVFWGVRDDGSVPPVSYVCTAVVRGKWNPDALALCDREGIELNRCSRQVS